MASDIKIKKTYQNIGTERFKRESRIIGNGPAAVIPLLTEKVRYVP
jgi:hypothetical protein